MGTFGIAGATLDFDVRDEPGGPAVVALHGLTSSRRRESLMRLDVASRVEGIRLLRYDARGHGRSGGTTDPATYRWPALARDLLGLLDHVLPGERVHGVGPSMGAGTLLHAALADPGRFASLTLLLPPTAWDTRRARSRDYERSAEAVAAHGVAALDAGADDADLPPAARGRPHTDPDVRADLLPAILRGAATTDLPAPDELGRITVPVQILAWTGDPGHPESTAATLRERLPAAGLSIAATPDDVVWWSRLLAARLRRWETVDPTVAGGAAGVREATGRRPRGERAGVSPWKGRWFDSG
ncbi:alpha/beta fold hydrolase [Pseudonocardia sp. ICBG1293]|uniref:alpha/beta fold hydrolase n=1 Tax=Pseudonocardia sp. ICBG1293 TaxID=2844382 RepID=UPI001CCD0762|nr:alpha/beta hydrolase [Pseudonocardia sp. ICBG1293]